MNSVRAGLFLVAVSALAGVARGEDVGTLRIVAAGVQERPGKLVVRLYNSSDHWLEPAAAIRSVVTDPVDGGVVSFEGLAPGRYAVSIVHDENGNQTMDLAFFPLPHVLEGGGVSNNVRPKWGPRRFDDAVFELRPPEQTVTITLRY